MESNESPTPAYFDLLTAAHTGDLDRFRNGRGSLAFAAAGGRLDVCRYLLKELSVNINVTDHHDVAPLSYAAINGHLEIVNYLLEEGADADGGKVSAKTPLQYALLGGNAMILELLLDNGANLTQTPLPYAALLGQVAAVGVLLKWGLDPDGGPNSISPLVAAIISNSVDIVNMLLEAKACPDKQSRGFVPLTFAAHYGLTNIVKSLVKANANTSVTDKDKMTALEIAAAAGNREMVKDLLPVTDLISKYPDCWTTDGLINLFDSVEDYDAGV